jgi:hypothetical protein
VPVTYVFPTYEQLRSVRGGALVAELDGWEPGRRTWPPLAEAFAELARTGGEGAEFGSLVAPPWVSTLVRQRIREPTSRWIMVETFSEVRTLERLGLVALEPEDEYVLAMVSGFGDRSGQRRRADLLRADPDLVDRALWRVFEVEGSGEVSLAALEKYSAPEDGWRQTFLDLVADGTLPRARVLRCCLQALGRDFSAFRAGWFAGTYLALAPTLDELAADQPLLRGLLRADVTATVSAAVRHLTRLDKAGRLDDQEFVSACAPVLTIPAKGTAVAMIRLLERVAQRHPDLAAGVAEAAGRGLEHPNADVQTRALGLLRTLDAPQIVSDRLAVLEPSVRREAATWLGTNATDIPARGETLPSAAVPLASQLTAVTAVDLLERVAALLEQPSDPVEVELVIAALAGLDDPAQVLRPLAKRATTVVRRDDDSATLRRHLASLVLTGCGATHEAAEEPGLYLGLLTGRLAEVGALLRPDLPPTLLLATPTSPEGWVEPGTLVERLRRHDGRPAHHDLVAALLRVALDGRGEALQAARDLPGEAGAALRYALGGDPADITTPGVWVAAARARRPLDDDPHLIRAGLDGPGQGRVASYTLAFRPDLYEYESRGRTYRGAHWRASLTVDPSPRELATDQPTVVDGWYEMPPDYGWLGDWLPWAALTWPHDAEPFFALGVYAPLETADPGAEVNHDSVRVLDALRAHPGRLGPMAAATLAVGLSGGTAAERTRAADAFTALVPAGRITSEQLADAMAHLRGPCTATRWATSLRDAATAGPGPAKAVVATLTGLLPRLDADHAGLHALLTVLHEESLRLGASPNDLTLRAWLSGLAGASKAARTAAALLAEPSHAASDTG